MKRLTQWRSGGKVEYQPQLAGSYCAKQQRPTLTKGFQMWNELSAECEPPQWNITTHLFIHCYTSARCLYTHRHTHTHTHTRTCISAYSLYISTTIWQWQGSAVWAACSLFLAVVRLREDPGTVPAADWLSETDWLLHCTQRETRRRNSKPVQTVDMPQVGNYIQVYTLLLV